MKIISVTPEEEAVVAKLRREALKAKAGAESAEVVRARGGSAVQAAWSDAAREAAAKARSEQRGHTREGDEMFEGMDVRAHKNYGGKVGRVTGFDKDKSFVTVKHRDGSAGSYHHSDLHTHDGDEDDDAKASDFWRADSVRAAGTSEGASWKESVKAGEVVHCSESIPLVW